MKKQTFFMTLAFTLGLALLFFVGFTACQKDGMEAETALASADGQTTYEGDSDGKVTSRGLCDCECEYRIYSVTGNPSPGNHTEMLMQTNTDFCSSCPLAAGFYGSCYDGIWGTDPCFYDMGYGTLGALPTHWIPFNCTVAGGQDFTKRYYLTQWSSGCSPFSVAGQIAYGVRCRAVGT